MLNRTALSRRVLALAILPVPVVLGVDCTTDVHPAAGDAPVIGAAQQAQTSSGLDPTCTNAGNHTVNSAGFPAHEEGPCPSTDEFSLADAVASCGGSVAYFSFFCSDFEDGTHTWTAYFGCCEQPPAPGPSFPAQGCLEEGGVCVAAGTCVPGGGTVAPSVDGCSFTDVAAECCVPPAPAPVTCNAQGGVCAPIGGCLQAGGYLTSNPGGCESQGSSFACCVPHERCGDQTIDCCGDGTVFMPTCDNGHFVCSVEGTVPAPIGTCPGM